jgi:hypothetical protein
MYGDKYRLCNFLLCNILCLSVNSFHVGPNILLRSLFWNNLLPTENYVYYDIISVSSDFKEESVTK